MARPGLYLFSFFGDFDELDQLTDFADRLRQDGRLSFDPLDLILRHADSGKKIEIGASSISDCLPMIEACSEAGLLSHVTLVSDGVPLQRHCWRPGEHTPYIVQLNEAGEAAFTMNQIMEAIALRTLPKMKPTLRKWAQEDVEHIVRIDPEVIEALEARRKIGL
jgi:hypothetical protein